MGRKIFINQLNKDIRSKNFKNMKSLRKITRVLLDKSEIIKS